MYFSSFASIWSQPDKTFHCCYFCSFNFSRVICSDYVVMIDLAEVGDIKCSSMLAALSACVMIPPSAAESDKRRARPWRQQGDVCRLFSRVSLESLLWLIHVASASSSGVGTMMTLASGRAGPRLGATSLTQPLSGTQGNFITTTRFSYATQPSAGPHTHVRLYFLYHDISSMTYASRLQETAHFCALLPSACNRESPCAAIDTTHPLHPTKVHALSTNILAHAIH